MKAIAKCLKCGRELEETCDCCIARGDSNHKCVGGKFELVEGIKWECVPETEDELKQIEEGLNNDTGRKD